LKWLRALDSVAWAVPISLGDSHGPYRVIGTEHEFFEHIRTGEAEPLVFTQGKAFTGLWEVVIGASVARQLGYKLDASIVLEHGLPSDESQTKPSIAPKSFGISASHEDKPFRVVGLLAPTGTAIDRSLFVSLESIEALHVGWQAGAPIPGLKLSEAMVRKFDLSPKQISAVYIGLKQRNLLFRTQRQIESGGAAAMTAAAPGLALADLWQLIGKAEAGFSLLAFVMLIVSMLGMGASLLASMRERERELSLLRVLGARPWQIALLVVVEALLAASLALVCSLLSLSALIFFFREALLVEAGLRMSAQWLRYDEWPFVASVYACALLVSLLPALRAYRISLQQGMMER
jgi:putative ABC transport system permease protein